ncbi:MULTISPECIES: beta-aspartyl-peptidase [Alteromonadaceae]|uniref:Isoaspartyl dipeptidase n=1 Tax=Brumicola blandensis TaxID=3075611 RepID=A0AAW8R2Y5_9ALTE|nr:MULTISPECIES: beta-aspartyl-peptidase [unclassified Alteromonas]MDT0582458.1 beta-aspartyl-peptidase [Alteromonas sp. W409]MDT0628681.1 beta-aspartyl-peptidase [Alteromonas sp. W364]
MITIIKNANVYSPSSLGLQHIVIAENKIVYMGDTLPELNIEHEVLDANGCELLPGFVDGHTHITGGGGEAGFSTRVPPVPLSKFTRAGVTTAVGLLGTDDTTRSTESLVAQVYALREEGFSAYCYTGGYHLPPTTLTGSVKTDIVFIEPVIGVGELAISDHRSSQPTLNELLKIASEAHVARLMTGKAGMLHLHLGDGKRGLELIRQALDTAEIPARTYNPTHINRQRFLFEEACELAKRGCWVDVTAFETGKVGFEPGEALLRYMQQDLPQDKLTISSDGGGCLPDFNCDGSLRKMDFADSQSMTDIFYELIDDGQKIEDFLPFFTLNVAKLMNFHQKGRIEVGADADLIILNKQKRIEHVMAMGRWHVRDNQQTLKGTFE